MKHCSTGWVSSPLLFTLLCKLMQNHAAEQSSYHILWWLILRLLHVNDCPSWYFRDIATSKLLRSLTGGEWGSRTRRPMTIVPLNWWACSNTYSIMINNNWSGLSILTICALVLCPVFFMSEHTLRGHVSGLTNVAAGCPAFLPCSLCSSLHRRSSYP